MTAHCCRGRAWCPAAWIAAIVITGAAVLAGLGLPPIAQALPAPIHHEAVATTTAKSAWPADDLRQIVIESSHGAITVIGTDRSDVQVRAEFARTEPARPDPRLSLSADDGVLRIAPAEPGSVNRLMEMTVEIPRHMSAVVRSASGAVVCRDLEGGLDVQALSGDIELRNVTGHIAAEVSAGDITVVHSPAWGENESLSCKTLDGSIDITLPAESEFDLAVRSLNAPFASDFPIAVRGSFQRRAFESRVGDGGIPITLNTLDGAIALRQHD